MQSPSSTRSAFTRHLALCTALAAGLLLAACTAFPPASFPGSGDNAGKAQVPRPAAGAAGQPAQANGSRLPPAPPGPSPATLEANARRAPPAEQATIQLQAARGWLQAGRTAEATRVLANLPAALTPAQAIDRRVLEADIVLANGDAQQAWQKMSLIPAPTGTPAEAQYLQSRMHIALAAARPVDGVRAEIAAERLVADAEGRARLRAELLQALRVARQRGVKLEAEASTDTIVKGWLELGALSTGGASLGSSATAARWRAQYPGHPATELLTEALPAPLPVATRLHRVALLLPLTGPASGFAAIVKSGFDFALQQLPAAAQPTVQVYDTGTVPVPEALRQARAEGADFIVGPLTRPEVDAALAAGAGPPTLALNYASVTRGAPAGFYQFALSPEDEARAVARRVLASGARRGVTLAPTGDWGTRVQAAFVQELQAGGGIVVAQGVYDPNGHDFGPPIRAVLATDRSFARRQRLEQLGGGKLEFEPRARADLDFVFAPGQAAGARLLRPQLRFQYAGNVPVYATDDAYAVDGGVANQDLEGLIIPAMPWLVPGSSAQSLHDAVRDAVQVSAAQSGAGAAGSAAASAGNAVDTSWQTGLYAFGYDACQMALALSGTASSLRSSSGVAALSVAGLTGQLGVDPDGRIRREPLWARIGRNGLPQLLPAGAANPVATAIPVSE
jgi:outer membrane PBP1 activator LpoA protein